GRRRRDPHLRPPPREAARRVEARAADEPDEGPRGLVLGDRLPWRPRLPQAHVPPYRADVGGNRRAAHAYARKAADRDRRAPSEGGRAADSDAHERGRVGAVYAGLERDRPACDLAPALDVARRASDRGAAGWS